MLRVINGTEIASDQWHGDSRVVPEVVMLGPSREFYLVGSVLWMQRLRPLLYPRVLTLHK